jgi:hypothetical protein
MSGDQIQGTEKGIPGSAGEKAVAAVEEKNQQIEGLDKKITTQILRDDVEAMINAKVRSLTKPHSG